MLFLTNGESPTFNEQDYVPKHEGVVPKLSWEDEQLGHFPKSDIARWHDR